MDLVDLIQRKWQGQLSRWSQTYHRVIEGKGMKTMKWRLIGLQWRKEATFYPCFQEWVWGSEQFWQIRAGPMVDMLFNQIRALRKWLVKSAATFIKMRIHLLPVAFSCTISTSLGKQHSLIPLISWNLSLLFSMRPMTEFQYLPGDWGD